MPTELPTFETLLLERKRDVLFVWLNRPETRNALGKAMVRDLTAVADLLAADSDIRAAVIRGANGTFCSGGDINGFKEMFETPAPKPGEKDGIATHNRRFGAIMSRFEALPQTIVMVVEGAAYGGGLGLMCGGDVVLAHGRCEVLDLRNHARRAAGADRAVRRRAHRRRAHAAAVADRASLRRHARRSASGWSTGPARDTAALEAALADVLAGIARCAPGANAVTKRLILASRSLPREELLDQSADAFAACLRSEEGREGVTAFREKRKAKWAQHDPEKWAPVFGKDHAQEREHA